MKIVKYGYIEFTGENGLNLHNFEVDGEGDTATERQILTNVIEGYIEELSRRLETSYTIPPGWSTIPEDVGSIDFTCMRDLKKDD